MQDRAAGDQQVYLWACGDQVSDERGCWKKMLEVVKQQEQVLVLETALQQGLNRLGTLLAKSERLGYGTSHQLSIAQRRK
jgi:hypothetical protein